MDKQLSSIVSWLAWNLEKCSWRSFRVFCMQYSNSRCPQPHPIPPPRSRSCLPSWISHSMNQRKDIHKPVVNIPAVCLTMWRRRGWRNGEKGKWNSLCSKNEFSAYMEGETQAEYLICCINIPVSSLINEMESGWLIQWVTIPLILVFGILLCSMLYGAELWGLKQAVTQHLKIQNSFLKNNIACTSE